MPADLSRHCLLSMSIRTPRADTQSKVYTFWLNLNQELQLFSLPVQSSEDKNINQGIVLKASLA